MSRVHFTSLLMNRQVRSVSEDGMNFDVRPRLLRRFSDEDNVGVGMAAEYAEASAVRRPTEVENLLRIKGGDLSATRAVERLHPEIVHTVFADRVGTALPSGVKLKPPFEIRSSASIRCGGEGVEEGSRSTTLY